MTVRVSIRQYSSMGAEVDIGVFPECMNVPHESQRI